MSPYFVHNVGYTGKLRGIHKTTNEMNWRVCVNYIIRLFSELETLVLLMSHLSKQILYNIIPFMLYFVRNYGSDKFKCFNR